MYGVDMFSVIGGAIFIRSMLLVFLVVGADKTWLGSVKGGEAVHYWVICFLLYGRKLLMLRIRFVFVHCHSTDKGSCRVGLPLYSVYGGGLITIFNSPVVKNTVHIKEGLGINMCAL